MTQTIYDIAVITAIFATGMLVGYLLKAWMDRGRNKNRIKELESRIATFPLRIYKSVYFRVLIAYQPTAKS